MVINAFRTTKYALAMVRHRSSHGCRSAHQLVFLGTPRGDSGPANGARSDPWHLLAISANISLRVLATKDIAKSPQASALLGKHH